MRNLRAWYRVPNKNGDHPSLTGVLIGPDIDISLRVTPHDELDIRPERGRDIDRYEKALQHNDSRGEPSLFAFPIDRDPPQREMARFLAKMALEALALWVHDSPTGLDNLIDSPHFDRIRHFARRGDNFDEWPYGRRRIFPEETLMRHPISGEWVQAGFGYDLFLTKRRETFFVFCLYGVEYVINTGGPSIAGYNEWLADHHGISPFVERHGMKLMAGIEGDPSKFYLVGIPDSREFDRPLIAAFRDASVDDG
ncbi:hypothetical protein [Sorangium atrum]|uniref:Nitroreductase domain-containing protein n=1 Tax=Sorangium atrum TaxID=2995308 RepID=A0ABT5C1E8_9BACT|nr:hypothetical protein [Sorangium aterium]MDC0679011.1 hypothetical protein [Sorangium aterium]